MSSLLEISKGIQDLFETIEAFEREGLEVPPEVQDQVSELLTSQGDKIDRCATFVHMTETHIDFLISEKKILDEHIKRLASRIERMKRVAEMVMLAENSKKLEGLRGHSFSMRCTQNAIIKKEPHLLPQKFVKVQTEYLPDKLKIRAALKSGEKIDGCELVDSISIQVK